MPNTSATAFLQVQARQTLETPEEWIGFFAHAFVRIDALSPAFAPEYDLTSEQVRVGGNEWQCGEGIGVFVVAGTEEIGGELKA